MAKEAAILISIILIVAIVLSAIWAIPYIYTLIGFATWALAGQIITADDDMPGGWSNPDGTLPFPWTELLIKIIILASLCFVAFMFPNIRAL